MKSFLEHLLEGDGCMPPVEKEYYKAPRHLHFCKGVKGKSSSSKGGPAGGDGNGGSGGGSGGGAGGGGGDGA